jgi:hypothetical protein
LQFQQQQVQGALPVEARKDKAKDDAKVNTPDIASEAPEKDTGDSVAGDKKADQKAKKKGGAVDVKKVDKKYKKNRYDRDDKSDCKRSRGSASSR